MAPEQTTIVTTSESFDVEAELARFVADPCREELRLPHMTTGQRRHAKKIAENYPELVCRSYGLGQDRQLYFFKPGAARELKRRDMPDRPNDVVAECEKSSDGSPAPASTASGASTPTTTQSASQSPSRHIPEAPPGFFQVRNTFIHIEESNNDRIVRSMPHDMFSKCLLDESAPSGLPAPLVLEPTPIAAGAEVIIEGLTKCPEFNGRCGIVESSDEQTGRYNILLIDSQQLAKLKFENLRVTVPAPPNFEAAAPDFAPSFPSTPTWEEDHPLHTVLLNCAAR
eukprot:TRINITY_DN33970_c0_g1_i1.p1 TRINITY_DN33970_c0_g1~~TRINITY_DN33970_c0_g1_i1.p1  ORF type:complete len:284 (+),score=54.04 TRINITY_DN33970_c0_g1_i1:294-1145(+)